MHIEILLNQSVSSSQRQASRHVIQNGLAYLRASSRHHDSVGWTLRMFEKLIPTTNLEHSYFIPANSSSIIPEGRGDGSAFGSGRPGDGYDRAWSGTVDTAANGYGGPDTIDDMYTASSGSLDEPFSTAVCEDPERWLSEVFGENFLNVDYIQLGSEAL